MLRHRWLLGTFSVQTVPALAVVVAPEWRWTTEQASAMPTRSARQAPTRPPQSYDSVGGRVDGFPSK